jgi:hypothetical protein
MIKFQKRSHRPPIAILEQEPNEKPLTIAAQVLIMFSVDQESIRIREDLPEALSASCVTRQKVQLGVKLLAEIHGFPEIAMRGLARVILAAAAMTTLSPASAWWDLGHMTVAASAYQKLEPAIRTKVDRLLTLNPAYAKWTTSLPDSEKGLAAFTRAAVWADDIKRDAAYSRDKITDATAGRNIGYADLLVYDYWHYIDIPFTTDETPVRPPDDPNALTQLRLFNATLSSGADDGVKSYDLVWMLHLIGDLHQPLHATARFTHELDDDRGVNDEDIVTVGGTKQKPHLYWDALLGGAGTPAEAGVAAAQLPVPDPLEVEILDPALWLIESFSIAQNDAYTPLIGNDSGPFPVDQAYEARALTVARSQAALAGARLAAVINEALK